MKKNSPKILVIGGVAAGPAAAAKAKRVNPSAEVILFEQGEFISYGTCSMPYYIGGKIPHYERLITYTPSKLERDKGVAVRTFHRAEEILPHRRRIVIRDLQSDRLDEFEYDELILATGASVRKPDESWRAANVFVIKTLRDSIAIKQYLEEKKPGSAVIVGGGFIGMEMAEAFRNNGLSVTVIHKTKLPMNTLEPEAQTVVADELKRQGVNFIGEAEVTGVTIEKGSVTAVQTTKENVRCDMVLFALGFVPNTGLADSARIRCGKAGGFLVDARMRTNVDHIYAAGGCTEIRNVITQKPIFLPLANISNKTGWIAGENAAGSLAEWEGVVRTTAVRVFDLEVATVGLSAVEAETAGFRIVTETITAPTRVKSYPGSRSLLVKLVADRHSKRLLGANLIGEEGAALRADVLSVAIRNGMTIRAVADLDLMYTPPMAPVWDPILVAANRALKGL